MRSKWYLLLLIVGSLLLFSGCQANKKIDPAHEKQIYYLNKSHTGLEMHEQEGTASNVEEELAEIILFLQETPAKLEYTAPLQMGFTLNSYKLVKGKLYLDMSSAYRTLSATEEILVRAALVRSFSQISSVKYVTITIEGGQLHDSLGNAVGLMSADQFIDNAGDEINSYEKVRLRLYFVNEEGTALIATNRTMAYNTNISMEKLVIEQLISGPGADIADTVYPVINPSTKLMSISVKDGICYVNFDENFLTQIYNVTPEASIYAIVNSLTELTNVNKVQISINGDTNVMYRESINLANTFDRNLDLIKTIE